MASADRAILDEKIERMAAAEIAAMERIAARYAVVRDRPRISRNLSGALGNVDLHEVRFFQRRFCQDR
jgi:hypothetical protein